MPPKFADSQIRHLLKFSTFFYNFQLKTTKFADFYMHMALAHLIFTSKINNKNKKIRNNNQV